jgi:hypothetical protein
MSKRRLGLDSFDIPPPVPYDGPIHDIDGTLLPGQREAPDLALGRCQVLVQCHLETGHQGAHEGREPQVGAPQGEATDD